MHRLVAPPHNDQQWIVIFQDMLSLLLSFFILLFSMSEIQKTTEPDDFKARYHPKQSSGSPLPKQGLDHFKTLPPPALNLDYLQAILVEKIKPIDNLQAMHIIPYGDRVILSFPSDVVFESARSTLNDQTKKALYQLADGLRSIKNRIHIYGFADPRPIKGGPFVSNWELSMARALAVEHALRVGGYAQKLYVQGFAATDPLLESVLSKYIKVPDDAAENHIARRVDIVIFQTGV